MFYKPLGEGMQRRVWALPESSGKYSRVSRFFHDNNPILKNWSRRDLPIAVSIGLDFAYFNLLPRSAIEEERTIGNSRLKVFDFGRIPTRGNEENPKLSGDPRCIGELIIFCSPMW